MIKNRKIYNKLVDFLYEYIGEEWITKNKVSLTPRTVFSSDLNFDVLDEVVTTLFVEEIFGLLLPLETKEWFTTINDLVDFINDYIISKHFQEVWEPNIDHFQHSGINLIETVNDSTPSNVLDVGCGTNYFKNKINNLIGIDPVRSEADIKTTILDYETEEKYDAILMLGSVNFGSEKYIKQELQKIISLCNQNGKIYVRVNPGIDNPQSPWMDFFEWDNRKIVTYAKEFNLEVSDILDDYHGRLSFVYTKKGM